MTRIDMDVLNLGQAIDALRVQFPELEDDDQLRADVFQGETELEPIISRLIEMASEADDMVRVIQERIDRIEERMKRYARRYDALRALVLKVMERADIKRLVLPEATVSVGYKSPAPIVIDPESVPGDYCRFKRTPDMGAIKNAVEDGIMPDGVAMSNGGNVLRILTK